jgi:hypothetical protein
MDPLRRKNYGDQVNIRARENQYHRRQGNYAEGRENIEE